MCPRPPQALFDIFSAKSLLNFGPGVCHFSCFFTYFAPSFNKLLGESLLNQVPVGERFQGVCRQPPHRFNKLSPISC